MVPDFFPSFPPTVVLCAGSTINSLPPTSSGTPYEDICGLTYVWEINGETHESDTPSFEWTVPSEPSLDFELIEINHACGLGTGDFSYSYAVNFADDQDFGTYRICASELDGGWEPPDNENNFPWDSGRIFDDEVEDAVDGVITFEVQDQGGCIYNETVTIDMIGTTARICLLYTSPSPRDLSTSRMPSSA